MKKKYSDDDFIQAARARFDRAIEAVDRCFDDAEEDFCFLNGEQWPEEIKRERELEQRPCLTINKLTQAVAQATGDARLNKPAIKVRPVEQADDDDAEVLEGLIRHIEVQSSAPTAYITAYEHSVGGGFGHWRVTTEYADDDAFEQDIRIRRIRDPFSVVWDPDSVLYDKSDAKYCFVFDRMSVEAFEQKYPDKIPHSWEDSDYRRHCGDWYSLTDKTVRVAEYWEKKPCKKLLAQTVDGRVIDVTEFHKARKEIEAHPEIHRIREVESHTICMTLIDGFQALEATADWAGKYIPIVSTYGPEEVSRGTPRYRSLVRYAKDPQKMYNFWTTQITEKIALAPKAPYIGTSKMFARHKRQWATANTDNKAYLAFTADPDFPGMFPKRELPAPLNAAEIEQRNQAADDIKATTGLYDASLGNRSNETSGRAILARQREGDVATFPWMDNLSRSIQHTGRILVDLVPRIYDTQRQVRILGVDGNQKLVPINQPFMTPDGQVKVFDLARGKYDVEVTVGPSYTTQRIEAADSMMSFIQAIPGAAPIIGDLIAQNMDWPGADEIAERMKHLLPPELQDVDDLSPEEQQAMEQMKAAQAQKQEEAEMIAKEKTISEIRKNNAHAAKMNEEAKEKQLENAQAEGQVYDQLTQLA